MPQYSRTDSAGMMPCLCQARPGACLCPSSFIPDFAPPACLPNLADVLLWSRGWTIVQAGGTAKSRYRSRYCRRPGRIIRVAGRRLYRAVGRSSAGSERSTGSDEPIDVAVPPSTLQNVAPDTQRLRTGTHCLFLHLALSCLLCLRLRLSLTYHCGRCWGG